MKAARIILASLAIAGAALAEDAKPAPRPEPLPPPAAASSAQAKPAAPTAPAPAAATAGMSQSKFLGLLYAEIVRQTPSVNAAGPGEVAASFRVNAQGKVETIAIEKSSSPAHAQMVKTLLGKVQAPPPPGGAFDASQTFKFH